LYSNTEIEEAFTDFFDSPFIKDQPLPFSEQQIRNESNDIVKRSMNFVDSLFGMKIVGEPFEEDDRFLLQKAIAVLEITNKINTSQGKAIMKQLFSL